MNTIKPTILTAPAIAPALITPRPLLVVTGGYGAGMSYVFALMKQVVVAELRKETA